jgi:hypothetical protein
MNNTINPATGTPYVPQVNLTQGPISPPSTAISPATGTPYAPQVNMNGPATNNPGMGANGVSLQPPTTTTAPAQPNTTPLTAPPTVTPATTPQN